MATEEPVEVAFLESQGEAQGGDPVRRVKRGGEGGVAEGGAEAKDGWPPVVGAEAVDEHMVGNEAAPALADKLGTWEGGWQQGQSEQDLPKKVVVFHRERRRR